MGGGRFGGAPTLGPVSSSGERRSEREKLGERRGGVRGQGLDVCEGWALVSGIGMASLVSGVPRLSRASFEGGGGGAVIAVILGGSRGRTFPGTGGGAAGGPLGGWSE